MTDRNSRLSRAITWMIIGILAIIAIKIALRLVAFLVGVLGMVFGIAMFALFTVGPILLLGWLAVAAWRAFTKEPAV